MGLGDWWEVEWSWDCGVTSVCRGVVWVLRVERSSAEVEGSSSRSKVCGSEGWGSSSGMGERESTWVGAGGES